MRLNVFRVGYKGNGKLIRAEGGSLNRLLEQCRSALKCPNGSVIFNSVGAEVDDVDLLDDKEVIYLSSGEEFEAPTRACRGSFVFYRTKTTDVYSIFSVDDSADLTFHAFRKSLSSQLGVDSVDVAVKLESSENLFESVEDIEAGQSYQVMVVPKNPVIDVECDERLVASKPMKKVSSASLCPAEIKEVKKLEQLDVCDQSEAQSPVSRKGLRRDDSRVSSVLDSFSELESSVDGEDWAAMKTIRLVELIRRTEEVKEQIENMQDAADVQELLDDSTGDLVSLTLNIVRDQVASQYFQAFLKKTYCEENLLFLNAVSQYQGYPSLRRASEIYHSFIERKAPYQVNLPSDILFSLDAAFRRYLKKEKKSSRELSNLDRVRFSRSTSSSISIPGSPVSLDRNDSDEMLNPELFDDAHESVTLLLVRDCLPRFLNTEEYRNMKQNLKRHEARADRRIHPLHIAARKGNVAGVEAALALGVLLDLKNELGDTAMHLAASNGKINVMQTLYEHHAEIDSLNDAGDTPLALACAAGRAKACRFLLLQGAEVNSTNSVGDTPLHHAARANSLAVGQLLVENHASLEVRNVAGQTPLHVAGRRVGSYLKNLLFKPLLKSYRENLGEGDELIMWSSQWSVNVESCDLEHQQLFEYLNLLWKMVRGKGPDSPKKKGSTNLLPILNALSDYTKFHFANEEDLMKRSSYPRDLFKKHKKEHVMFTRKVGSFIKQFRAGEARLDDKLLNFLRDWLKNHIAKVDMEYSNYIGDDGLIDYP